MMNEFEINSFISEVRGEMELIRVFQNKPIELTDDQKKQLDELKGSEQDALRQKFITEADEKRKERVMLLIMALEDKLKNSNLPDKVKEQLTGVIDKVKNNQITITTEIDREIKKIEENEREERKTEKDKEVDGVMNGFATAVATTAALVAATGSLALAVASTEEPETPVVQPTTQETTISSVAGVPVLRKNADPVVVRKIRIAAKKAMRKIRKDLGKINKTEPLTLEKIAQSKATGMEKKVARIVFLEENPAVAKDLVFQEEVTNKKAAEHSALKQKQEKAKRELSSLITAENQATDPKVKEDLHKQVEEQSKKVAEATREREKYSASVSHSIGTVIDQAKLDELSKQKKELNVRIGRTKSALNVAKTEEEKVALQKTLDEDQVLFRSLKDEIRACYNRPQYNRRQQIAANQIKAFRERLGVAATPQEIIEGVPKPAQEACKELLQKECPECFQNQIGAENHRKEVADTRVQRKLEEKRKFNKILEEKGKVTTADKLQIRKELDEQFNPNLKQFLAHHQLQPNQQAVIAAQMVNVR